MTIRDTGWCDFENFANVLYPRGVGARWGDASLYPGNPPSRARLEDNIPTIARVFGDDHHAWWLRAYGISKPGQPGVKPDIPEHAKIVGIESRLKRRIWTRSAHPSSHMLATARYLIYYGTTGGEDETAVYGVNQSDETSGGPYWSDSYEWKTFGGPTNTWGLVDSANPLPVPLTPAVVLSDFFGVAMLLEHDGVSSATADPAVDHIQIKIYYDTPSDFFMTF